MRAQMAGIASAVVLPDNRSLPTCSGTYREKVNAALSSLDAEVPRIAQYRLRTTLVGTDGSSYTLRLSGKLTMNAKRRLVVSRDHFSCT